MLNNGAVTELANLLSQQLTGGSGTVRASFGSKDQAFAWCNPVLNSAVSYVNNAVALNTTFSVTRVLDGGPLDPWTSGTKPVSATLESVPVTLKTYPGVVEVKSSDVINGANLTSALYQALYGQAVRALDADLIAALIADGSDLDAAPDLASIAQAQATLMGAGSFGDLVILSPTEYAALIGTSGGLVTGSNDPREAQLTMFGAQIVVSSALPAGTSIVMDRNAATAVELDSSPVALVDVHARTNVTDIVIEAIAGAIVTRPDSVIVIADATP